MKAGHIVTLVLLLTFALLVITHAGGFATDVVAGGNVSKNLIGTLSGSGRSAGVNVPKGVSLNLAG